MDRRSSRWAGLAQSLARDLGPKGIHVAWINVDGSIDIPGAHGLNPSLTNSDFLRPEAIAEIYGIIGIRITAHVTVIRQTVARIGSSTDISVAVCVIASPLSDFMTITTFRINDGATRAV